MRKLFNKIPMPRTDRLKNFFVFTLGFLIMTIFLMPLFCLVTVFTVAFLKEVHDYFEEGNGFDLVDFFYSIIAPVLIFIIF